MTSLSTHVLDAAAGTPAAGLPVVLRSASGQGASGQIATAVTDADGRIRWQQDLQPGAHTLTFATGEWFAAANRATFYPRIDLNVDLSGEHVHVAVLLSPYSYTTYKGS